KSVFEEYIDEPGIALAPAHAEAIRNLVRDLTTDEAVARLFPADILGEPMSALRTNPTAVFAADDARARVNDEVAAAVERAAKAMLPPLSLPPSFFARVRERLGTVFFYYFVEIAVKENDKAGKQIGFENAIETFKRLWSIEGKVDSIKADTSSTKVVTEKIWAFLESRGSVIAATSRPTLSNLPPLSSNIIPRKDITTKIHAALAHGAQPGVVKQAAANAHGGYGKTVAALLYAHEHANFYTGGRFFLSMENADFITQLASLGRHFNVPDDAKPDHAALLVKQGLEREHPSLLILDNITGPEQWKLITDSGLLPALPCRVLITTRADSIPQARMVKIGRLSDEEARAIYANFCDGVRDAPDDATADAITNWLEGLAVAIAAVGAFMKLTPALSWANYWENLQKLRTDELPDADEQIRAELGMDTKGLEEHRRTLRVLDDAINALPAPERRAVEYAALLPADMVPVPWLEWLLNADAARATAPGSSDNPDSIATPSDSPQRASSSPGKGVAEGRHASLHQQQQSPSSSTAAASDNQTTPDPLAITFTRKPGDPTDPAIAALSHLESLDVLRTAGENGKLLSLHRLWRQRLNERAQATTNDRAPLWSTIAACAQSRRDTIIGRDEEGIEHGLNKADVMTDASLRWELVSFVLLSRSLWNPANSPQASRPHAARLGIWLAPVLHQLGRHAEARSCLAPIAHHEETIAAFLGPSSLAACWCNLGPIERALSDLGAARRSLERSIEILSEHYAEDDPALATSWSNLALVQQDQGDLAAARHSIERAIAIDLEHFAQDHPNLATRWSNLATIQQGQGKLAEARQSIERAIAIELKHFPGDHPVLATSWSNLAAIQAALGEPASARHSIERAIAIQHSHFPDDHPTLAVSWSNLATIQWDLGDFVAARSSIEHAIAIELKNFPENHPNLAVRLSNLALIQRAQGDLLGARASITRAIAIEQACFSEDHPNLATRWSNLAAIQQTQGDLSGARSSVERSIAIDRKHFAEDHPNFAIRYNNVAYIDFVAGDKPAACLNFNKALSILLKHFDENHPHVKTVRASMKAAGCTESRPRHQTS
ncbi:MAG TPA: tetratricopeptide repeat protein, partial [Phycisphaerales bacterium]|nr:tetratricopeptide repeat protein [Phycisphaerales bacterium]